MNGQNAEHFIFFFCPGCSQFVAFSKIFLAPQIAHRIYVSVCARCFLFVLFICHITSGERCPNNAAKRKMRDARGAGGESRNKCSICLYRAARRALVENDFPNCKTILERNFPATASHSADEFMDESVCWVRLMPQSRIELRKLFAPLSRSPPAPCAFRCFSKLYNIRAILIHVSKH